jgi:hypothetical protein
VIGADKTITQDTVVVEVIIGDTQDTVVVEVIIGDTQDTVVVEVIIGDQETRKQRIKEKNTTERQR